MPRITRRLALATLAAPSLARADTFPTRPVTWIVPGAPGSVLDVGARLIAVKMAAVLGQNVVVDNKIGAGGTIGTEAAARAAPDGYTVFYGNFAVFAIAPLLFPNLRYDAQRDFVPIHGIAASANIVVAAPGRYRDIAALIAAAKARPDEITYAGGVGSGQHAAAALFAQVAGVRMTLVPYSSTTQALTDIAAGRVDVMFDYPLSSLPFVRDGRLRALAVNAPERLAIAPEIPTLADAGLRGAELLGWAGLYAPARTPPAAIARLAEATRVALRDPDVIKLFDSTGTILWGDVDAAKLAAALDAEIPRMRSLIARVAAKIE